MAIEKVNNNALREINNLTVPQVSIPESNKSVEHQKEPPKKGNEAAQKKLSSEQFNNALNDLNKYLQIFNSRLSFVFDEDRKMPIIRIQDRETGNIIKQIPPEEMIKSLTKISSIVGLLYDQMI